MKINHELQKLVGRTTQFTRDRVAVIGAVFDCDMKTAQNIVDRIGNSMGIGNDPIIVLKTAEPKTIAFHMLKELRGVKG